MKINKTFLTLGLAATLLRAAAAFRAPSIWVTPWELSSVVFLLRWD